MRRLLIGVLFSFAAWAQSEAPVRYIVELTEEPTIKAESLGERTEARAARVASEQQIFESRLASYAPGARAVARTHAAVNAVIVEGAPGQLQSLAAMPGVKRAQQARLLKQHMIDAMNTHLLTIGWFRAGGLESAGKGIKIAIIDSGIEPEHPAFQAPPDMQMPDGFPQASGPGNYELTTRKIIVMRSYDNLSARDRNGHGTAVAAVAAAVPHQSPRGLFIGAAPRAYLGVYRTNVGSSGQHREDFLLLALEDALNDNMNVINLSLGYTGLLSAQDTSLAQAARNIADRNVTVVVSAGNDGPEIMTSNPLGAYQQVISVGATQNARVTTQPRVMTPTGSPIDAGLSTNAATANPVSGQLVDVASLDGNGLACNPLPAESLQGFIPLILRGTCGFAAKLANAAAAGAQGAIVRNDPANPDAETLTNMDVSTNPTIPGLYVRASDGLRLKQELAANEEYQVVLQFLSATTNPNQIASFSSLGPPVDLTIKPDLVATGDNLYTATQTTNPTGLYSASGYITISGTSFSSPMVAGSAAVIRGAKPGLFPNDYRSLLINNTTPLADARGVPLPVQSAGSGSLNMDFAMRATVTAEPVSVSFIPQDSTFSTWRQVIVRNISAEPRTYTLSVETRDALKPLLTDYQVSLNPGEIAGPVLVFEGGAVPSGAYQGFIRIDEPQSGVTTRVPYWLAVKSTAPAKISLPLPPDDSRAGTVVSFYLRVHDSAGLLLMDPKPVIEPVLGAGSVISIDPSGFYPGTWFVSVRLGPAQGLNQFRVTAGAATRTISITALP